MGSEGDGQGCCHWYPTLFTRQARFPPHPHTHNPIDVSPSAFHFILSSIFGLGERGREVRFQNFRHDNDDDSNNDQGWGGASGRSHFAIESNATPPILVKLLALDSSSKRQL